MDAKFEITDSFKITGRGIALCGFIQEGTISIGDEMTFNFNKKNITRKIKDLGGVRTVPPTPKMSIIIECQSELEIEELRQWEPGSVISMITKSNKQ